MTSAESQQAYALKPIVDVNIPQLFGAGEVAEPSVSQLAADRLSICLTYLRQPQQVVDGGAPLSEQLPSPIADVVDEYIGSHPLGRLASSSPALAQGLAREAVRSDAVKMLGVLNHEYGASRKIGEEIGSLARSTPGALATAVPKLYREMLSHAMGERRREVTVAEQQAKGLWGIADRDRQYLRERLGDLRRTIERAQGNLSAGDLDVAQATFHGAFFDHQGTLGWYGRASENSEGQKQLARIGVVAVAGALSAYTGGAGLGLLGAAGSGGSVSLAAYTGSLLVNGATFTVAERALSARIFDEPFVRGSSASERAIDLAGEVLHNAALFGALGATVRLAHALPAATGEFAGLFNSARNFGMEVGGLTGFQAVASGSSLIDDHPRYARLDQVLSTQALRENIGFLLGLRAGNRALAGAKWAARGGIGRAINFLGAARWRVIETFSGARVIPARGRQPSGTDFSALRRAVRRNTPPPGARPPLALAGNGGAKFSFEEAWKGFKDAEYVTTIRAAYLAHQEAVRAGQSFANRIPQKFVPEIARAAYRVVHEAAIRAGLLRGQGPHSNQAVGFWTPLLLLFSEALDPAHVEAICLGYNPAEGTSRDMSAFKRLATQRGPGGELTDVQRALAIIKIIGLRSFLNNQSGLSRDTGDIESAETILNGAVDVNGEIDRFRAEINKDRNFAGRSYRVGSEYEAGARTTPPTFNDMVVTPRDEVNRQIADEYIASGYEVEIESVNEGDKDFVFPADTHYFPTIYEHFVSKRNGEPVKVYSLRLMGTGGPMHFAREEGAASPIEPVLLDAKDVFDGEGEAYRRVAHLLRLVPAEVKRMAEAAGLIGNDTYRVKYLLMVKDNRNGMFKCWMQFLSDGTVRVTPINGRLYTQTPADSGAVDRVYHDSLTINATDFSDAAGHIVSELLEGRYRVERTDLVTKLVITDPSSGHKLEIKLVDEQHPYYEVVTEGIVHPRHFPMLRPLFDALRARGYMGATPDTPLAMQTHMDTPLEVDGRWSLAPMLGMMRNFFDREHLIRAIFPSTRERGVFIKQYPESLVTKLSDPKYIPNTEDPLAILCVAAEIVTNTPEKYTVFNFDHYISLLLQEMAEDPESGIKWSAEGTVSTNWHGKVYTFKRVLTPSPGPGGEPQAEVYLLQGGGETKLTRVPRHSRKPTGEFRFPNQMITHPREGEHRIEWGPVEKFLWFSAAFGFFHGTEPFIESAARSGVPNVFPLRSVGSKQSVPASPEPR
ncbi:MAG: hypothetical protein HYV03_00640 [Deltaproteobacteria bacterium]|nr:hypothetical protein [Deltaproteobacteria bacterium]